MGLHRGWLRLLEVAVGWFRARWSRTVLVAVSAMAMVAGMLAAAPFPARATGQGSGPSVLHGFHYKGTLWAPPSRGVKPVTSKPVPGQLVGPVSRAVMAARLAAVARAGMSRDASAPVRYVSPRVSWPAGSATAALTGPAAEGERLEVTAGWRQAGSLPVSVAVTGGGDLAVKTAAARGTASAVRIAVATRRATSALGVRGLVLTVGGAGALAATGGTVALRVNYQGFAAAYGGAWGERLRLVELPGCALTSPGLARCRRATPVASANNGRGTLTADVSLPTASAGLAQVLGYGARYAGLAPGPAYTAGAAGSPTVVLAVQSGPSSAQGAYTATPLNPAGSWSVQDGDFSYSYPIPLPPSVTGAAPQVSLTYDSQSVDGETSAANTQGGWIGDGWDYSPGFIERSYEPCSQDPAAVQANFGDECWGGYNATLSLGGHSSQLVLNGGTGNTYHLQSDDGTTAQLLQGTNNGLWNNEYWLVTTTDGTKYYFGQNHLPGGNGSDPATNSAWGVPVYCPATTDPCYTSANGTSSWGMLGWQWNLDYVVSPQGALTVYNYQDETNYYERASALGGGTLTQYVRGGFPLSIEYGWLLSDAIKGAGPQAEVQFTSSQRCTGPASTCSSYANLNSSTASDWPDVPFDQICASTGSCSNDNATFFTTYMLTGIATQAMEGTSIMAMVPVDSWTLGQQFDIGTGTGNQSVLALTCIQRTEGDGDACGSQVTPIPAQTFISQEIDNQVPGAEYPPLDRPRMETIDTEAGAAITVNYESPACVQGSDGNPPEADTNNQPCFPAYWSGTGSTPDWFNKSLVATVSTTDLSGTHASAQVVSYSYLGGAAWHQNESPVISSQYRTWDQFRGFAQVETTTGAAPDPVAETVSTYMRGMDGDPNASGGTTSASVSYASNGPDSAKSAVPDSNWLAGQVLESDTYTGAGGSVDKAVVAGWPTAYAQTASQPQPGTLPALTAHMVTSAASATMELQNDGNWANNTVTTYYNGDALPVTVDSDPSSSGTTETCTATSYAGAPTGNSMMKSYPQQVTTVTGASVGGTCPLSYYGNIQSDTRYYYDQASKIGSLGNPGGLTSPGGLVTGVQRAKTWPSSGNEAWQDMSATAYDAYGRVTSVTDGRGYATTTKYNPTYAAGDTGALPQTVTVTNPMTVPKPWTTMTTYDQLRFLPLQVQDVNAEITSETYDSLGRLSTVTLPADQGLAPTYEYSYSVTGTAPPAVTTQTLQETGQYSTATVIYDGMLQQVQQQSPTIGNQAGRVDTNTGYNSLGQVIESDAPYWDTTGSPGTTLYLPDPGALTERTLTSYDGQGRVTATATYDGTTDVRQTATTYKGMNEADTTPPAGGTATTVITNILGQTTSSTAGGVATAYTYTPLGQVASIADANGNTWTYTYDLLGQKTYATDPGTTGTFGPKGNEGQTGYTYDTDGDLATTTDPNGQLITYTYDPIDRKQAEYAGTISGTKLASWTYDGATLAGGSAKTLGLLSESDTYSYNGTAKYSQTITGYNAEYEPTGQSTSFAATNGAPAATFSTSAVYGPLTGQLQSTSYGADGGLPAETVGYQYNQLGLLTGFGTTSSYYLDGTSFDATGQLQSATFGPAGEQLVQQYAWDQTDPSRLLSDVTNLQTDKSGAEDTTTNTYDQAGDLTSSMDAENAGTTSATTDLQCYAYNGQQELSTAWTDNGTQNPTPNTPNPGGVGTCANQNPTTTSIGGPATYWQIYQYDDLGSRTSQVSHDTASVAADTPANETTQAQAYPGGTNPTTAQPQPAAATVATWTGPGSTRTITPTYNAAGQIKTRTETTVSPLTSAVKPSSGSLCLDDAGNSTTAGNKIDIAACNGATGQDWTVNTSHELQVLGMCADVTGNGTATGTKIELEACSTSTKGEIWDPASNGTWINPNSTMCLTDPGGTTTVGTQLEITACATSTSTSQQWTTTAGTSYPLPGTVQTITYWQNGLTEATSDPDGTGTKTTSYIYDDSGNLLAQSDPGQVIYYPDGGAEEVIYNTTVSPATATAQRFFTSPDGTSVVRTSGGTVYYETTNAEHTAAEAINAANLAVVTRRYFDPYGVQLSATATWPDNKAYVGKPADTPVALDILGARLYSPALGAFLSLDPVLETGSPTQMGGYTYAANNPSTLSDPSGLQPPANNDPVPPQCAANITLCEYNYYVQNGGTTYPGGLPTGVGCCTSNDGNQAHRSPTLCFKKPILCRIPPTFLNDDYFDTNSGQNSQSNNLACTVVMFSLGSGFAGTTCTDTAAAANDNGGGGTNQPSGKNGSGSWIAAILAALGLGGADEAGAALSELDDAAAGCGMSFTATTKVLLANGRAAPIASLNPGDKVVATNTKTGKTTAEPVAAVLIHHDSDLYDLSVKTAHGTAVIHTTSHHLFWDPVSRAWVQAGRLRAGESLRAPSGAIITAIGGYAPRQHDGWMWDLTVTSDHDFYIEAAGSAVLVHNTNCGGSPALGWNDDPYDPAQVEQRIAQAKEDIADMNARAAARAVRAGEGPPEISRIDGPETSVPGSQWHAQGPGRGSPGINYDGTYHDGNPYWPARVLEWLIQYGWNIEP